MKHARPDYDRIQDPAGLIPEDEPVFLLRAQDLAAPGAIQAWCKEALKYGADPDIVNRAAGQALAMLRWQEEQPGVSKVPDL
jgi:hypothetical protein